MTNITEIIEKAGEDFSRNHNFASDRMLLEDGFEAGASFATSDPSILQAILQPFAEWLEGNKGIYTPEQLIQKYFADNKQKEDERV